MRTSRGPNRPAPAEPSSRATAALAAGLTLLVAVRLLSELATGARWWGLDHGRFMPPAWRFGPWLAALAVVVLTPLPPLRAAVARPVAWLGERSHLLPLLAGLATAALCLLLPDLTYFTGDFALRRSAVAGITDFDRLFPQATALDRLLHLVVPRALREWTGLPLEGLASTLGAVNAALFGALAAIFAYRCGARGPGAAVAAAVVAGTGALGLFTGYDKSFAELCVVTLALGVAGLGELARGRPGLTSGLLVALGIALHRSGLALIPAWLALWVMVRAPAAARGQRDARGPAERPGRRGRPPRPAREPAAPGGERGTRRPAGQRAGRRLWTRLVPGLVIASLLPSTLRLSLGLDARHLAPGGAEGALAAALEPARLVALANVGLFLVSLLPLLLVAPALTRAWREPSALWLAWLAACWLLPLAAIHPVQGEFRDWDVFAAGGVALSLPLAFLLARSAARAPAALSLGLAAAALVPRLQWLALEALPARSLARIEAWVSGPPAPPATAAAGTLEYVGLVHFRDRRIEDGRRVMAAAIEHVPWERLFLSWANAESMNGEWSRAIALFEEAARRYPQDATPWLMLAQAALQHGDRETAERGVAGLRQRAPGDPLVAQLEAAVAAMGRGVRR